MNNKGKRIIPRGIFTAVLITVCILGAFNGRSQSAKQAVLASANKVNPVKTINLPVDSNKRKTETSSNTSGKIIVVTDDDDTPTPLDESLVLTYSSKKKAHQTKAVADSLTALKKHQ